MNMPPLPEPVIVAVDQIVNSLNVQLREATARAEAAEQETAALRAEVERLRAILAQHVPSLRRAAVRNLDRAAADHNAAICALREAAAEKP